MVYGGLQWFLVVHGSFMVAGGGLRWFVVVYGGLRWFVVVCVVVHARLWWFCGSSIGG